MRIKDIAVWGTVHEGRVLPVSRGGSARTKMAPVDGGAGYGQTPLAGSPSDSDFSRAVVARLVDLLAHRH
jgi:hypothetical protein